jgi:hypothetical protein
VVSGNPHPVQPAGKIGQKISRHRIEPGGPLRIVEIVAQTQHARGLVARARASIRPSVSRLS